MMEEKGILQEMMEFLEYLAKIDSFPDKRNEEKLKEKFGKEKFDRIHGICFAESGYIRREVDTGKDRIYRSRITPKGLKFLEEYQIKKLEEKRLNYQNKLTAGLFTIAFLQATISIIYYFFDLEVRGFASQATIFSIGSAAAAIIFFILMFGGIRREK